MKGWLTILLLIIALPAGAIGVDDKTLADPAQEAAAREIMKDLRCLVCQNQSIEESDADMAADLRRIVRERVAAGDSPAEIRAFVVERFGDWILMRPPVKPSTWLLWGMPLLLVLGGGLAFALMLRRRQAAAGDFEARPLSKEEKQTLDRLRGEADA